MHDNEQNLQKILDDIFTLDSPRIQESRKQQIYAFIKTTVNGDCLREHLAFNANLGNKKDGAIVYILTNVRFIKIDIDENEAKSASYLLKSITGIERKIVDGDREQTVIVFQSASFGLKYPVSDEKISGFFQKVDQSRAGECSDV